MSITCVGNADIIFVYTENFIWQSSWSNSESQQNTAHPIMMHSRIDRVALARTPNKRPLVRGQHKSHLFLR